LSFLVAVAITHVGIFISLPPFVVVSIPSPLDMFRAIFFEKRTHPPYSRFIRPVYIHGILFFSPFRFLFEIFFCALIGKALPFPHYPRTYSVFAARFPLHLPLLKIIFLPPGSIPRYPPLPPKACLSLVTVRLPFLFPRKGGDYSPYTRRASCFLVAPGFLSPFSSPARPIFLSRSWMNGPITSPRSRTPTFSPVWAPWKTPFLFLFPIVIACIAGPFPTLPFVK